VRKGKKREHREKTTVEQEAGNSIEPLQRLGSPVSRKKKKENGVSWTPIRRADPILKKGSGRQRGANDEEGSKNTTRGGMAQGKKGKCQE